MLQINPTDAAPIWKQIEEGIRRMIALGTLVPGAPVPSVRDLARTVRVNPNTVARAYQRLIDTGVLVSRRGDATYVAETPPQPKRADLRHQLEEAAGRYAGTALALGASLDEAKDQLDSAFDRLVASSRRKS